jgi:hypothetical protein
MMRWKSQDVRQTGSRISAGVGLTSVGATLAVTALLLASGMTVAGTLNAFAFDDVVIVWKSQQHLETAADLVRKGKVRDGDFDSLVQCRVSSGHSAELLSSISDGLLVKVRVDGEDCEGVVFAVEYRE